jgi:hypothetical protein
VQYLEKDFAHHDQKHKERYAWICGVYAAMAMIFGLTDLHQGNIMLCQQTLTRARDNRTGTRHCLPYLTDLEIAFSNDVLSQAATTKLSYEATMLSKAMRKNNEVDYMNHFNFELTQGLLIKETVNNTPTQTDNLPRRRDGSSIYLVTSPNFGPQFKDGATRVFNILHNLTAHQKNNLMNRFVGCRVRFHAKPTAEQLDQILTASMWGKELTVVSLKPGRGIFLNTMLNDLNRFDVAYYVKHIGGATSGQVDHVDIGGPAIVAGGAAVTGGDVWTTVRTRLDNLPQGIVLNNLLDSIITDVTNPLGLT